MYRPDVIMDMFQAPTLLEDPFNNTSVLHAAEKDVDPGYPGNGKYAVNRRVRFIKDLFSQVKMCPQL